ncbi:MAG TPA: DUF4157 domain-containing protein [Acidimicrobiales bacterium]|nr:DUF4157 domain-containing protein [Acidimicrobiales bacterium]
MVGPGAAARVQVRTGPATREALAAAGRPAVTVGNVIHLPSAPDGSARSAEILAHELVHAGRPSPVPRFFDDDRDSSEERQARRAGGRVASLIRAFEARAEAGARSGTSDLAWGTRSLPVGPGASPLTVGAVGQLLAGSGGADGRRSGGPEGAPGAPGSVHRGRRSGRHRPGAPTSPGGPEGEWGGSDAGGSGGPPPDWLQSLPPAVADIVRRSQPGPGGAPGGRPDPLLPFSDPTGSHRPMPGRDFPGGTMIHDATPAVQPEVPFVRNPVSPMSSETLDWIVEAVEERVLAELERRGLRFQPGVF